MGKRIEIIKKSGIEDLPVGVLEEVRVCYKQKNVHHEEGQEVLLLGRVIQENGHKRLFDMVEARNIGKEFEQIEWISFIERS